MANTSPIDAIARPATFPGSPPHPLPEPGLFFLRPGVSASMSTTRGAQTAMMAVVILDPGLMTA